MTQKIPRKQINGWLNIDKQAGMSSAQVVGKIKFMTRAQKVGHAGTLDPDATGILPIALGHATKTIPFMQDAAKTYAFSVAWGQERDTDDASGQVIKTSDLRPTRAAIEAALPQFRGEIMQTPCAFSAVKIDGERAYDLAREGVAVKLEPRPIRIDAFTLVNATTADTADFTAVSGKGAYMRALARDLGRVLGCYGHLTQIRRLAVGPFVEKNSISLAQLQDLCDTNALNAGLLPIHAALDDIPGFACDPGQARVIRNGQAVVVTSAKAFSHPVTDQTVIRVMLGGDCIAIGQLDDGYVVPLRIIGTTGKA